MKSRTIPAAVLFGLGLTLAYGGLASAGEDSRPRSHSNGPSQTTQKRVAMRLQELAVKLDLTDTQKTTLRPILEAEAREMRALRMNTAIEVEAQQAELQSIHERYRDQIKSVLTPDQQTRLEELRQQARAKLDESAGQKRKGRIPVSPDVD